MVGQLLVRFEIQKMQLLFFKYILQQNEESMLKKFLNLQLENKTEKGIWASTCLNDLKELRVNETLEEIKNMNKNKFKNMLKQRIKENALTYLIGKQGTKGKYLHPSNSKLSIDQKRRMFGIKNKMLDISTNFPTKYPNHKCEYGDLENMEHIYQCEIFGVLPKIPYVKIYNGSIQEQIEVFNSFEKKMRERDNIMNNTLKPRDPFGIHCSVLDSNG